MQHILDLGAFLTQQSTIEDSPKSLVSKAESADSVPENRLNVVPRHSSVLGRLASDIRFSHLKTRSWRTKVSVFLIFAAVVSGVATYAALNGLPPFGKNANLVVWLLNIDLIILLLLVSLIARRIVSLWSGRKRKIAGSHLHVRLVYIFSLLAAVPTIIMTVFSAIFFHYGVQAWFSQRVQTAINESQAVAEAYLEEHKRVIRVDVLAMANDLDRYAEKLVVNESALSEYMEKQTFHRNLSEAVIITAEGKVMAKSALAFSLEYERLPSYGLRQAEYGDVIVMMSENNDRMRALVKLEHYGGAFLVAGRMVDKNVLSHLDSTRKAVEDYEDLQSKTLGIQVTVTMIFVMVGLLLLCTAIWFGLILARQIVKPIIALIAASDRVRSGDLTSSVPEQGDLEEFDYLAKSFNRMTSQIHQQQSELIEANRLLDRRRRFTETVLAGVSSGVIGLDNRYHINLANHSAARLLARKASDMDGRNILDIIPELKEPLIQAQDRSGKITQAELQITVASAERRTFLFKIATDLTDGSESGAILTFDDISELQSAQRKAAWSDVARRIAHEIKNPLTPIQLSAERLKRRYLKQIHEDPETFAQCTDTIIRHVGDIGRMVNEFSSFARMPDAVLRPENLLPHIKDCLVLPKQAHSGITFGFHADKDVYEVEFDAQQVRQAMANLLQNAIDSIEIKGDGKNPEGRIDLLMDYHGNDEIFVAVTDSGTGFPKNEEISKLTDPYVTHKPKGTGLGLAIVKKIMEDNKGQIILNPPRWVREHPQWTDLGGACVVLLFPAGHTSKGSENHQKEEKVA